MPEKPIRKISSVLSGLAIEESVQIRLSGSIREVFLNWCRRFLGIKEVIKPNAVKEESFMGKLLLASVSSEMEAEMIETLLTEENIPGI
jgi:hypothetical protein